MYHEKGRSEEAVIESMGTGNERWEVGRELEGGVRERREEGGREPRWCWGPPHRHAQHPPHPHPLARPAPCLITVPLAPPSRVSLLYLLPSPAPHSRPFDRWKWRGGSQVRDPVMRRLTPHSPHTASNGRGVGGECAGVWMWSAVVCVVLGGVWVWFACRSTF